MVVDFDPSLVTDQELADACCPDETADDKSRFLANLSDPHRTTLKRMIWAANELNAGRRPAGVIVCTK